jgi:hypothetical protein
VAQDEKPTKDADRRDAVQRRMLATPKPAPANDKGDKPPNYGILDAPAPARAQRHVNWTLALSGGRRSCIHPHKAGLFALEEDAIHRSCGHSGAVEADCEARVPG